MAWDKKKTALTTGDIAKFSGVNFRTVIRWIQQHHLKAFQLPGRGDNRVLIKDYLSFVKENNMPIPDELNNFSNRVLVIEDDSTMAKAIEQALTPDFDTVVASNGFEAGNLAHTFAPAVVTFEPGMAGTGGLDAIKALSNDPNLLTARVLVISSLPKETLDEALEAGAAEVISKPFADEDLLAAVVRLTDRQ